MTYIFKYLTMAPVMAILTLVAISAGLIFLNHSFPGLQYGTYFHNAP